MNRFLLYILFIALSPALFAQTNSTADTTQSMSRKPVFKGLRVQYGLNLIIPLKDEDREDPNVPDRFEVLEKRPSIAAFFDGSLGQTFDLSAGISNDLSLRNEFIFGLSYSYNEYDNKVRSSEEALGSVLKSRTISPYVGYGSYYDNSHSVFFYGFMGPAFKSFEGNYSRGSLDYVTEYSDAPLIRFGARMQVNGKVLPTVITFGFEVEIGNIEAESVTVYRDGDLLESANFTSDNQLSANSVIFTISGGLDLFKFSK